MFSHFSLKGRDWGCGYFVKIVKLVKLAHLVKIVKLVSLVQLVNPVKLDSLVICISNNSEKSDNSDTVRANEVVCNLVGILL